MTFAHLQRLCQDLSSWYYCGLYLPCPLPVFRAALLLKHLQVRGSLSLRSGSHCRFVCVTKTWLSKHMTWQKVNMCEFGIKLSTIPGQKTTFHFPFTSDYILYHLSSTTANLDCLCSAAPVCSVADYHYLSEIKLILKDRLVCPGSNLDGLGKVTSYSNCRTGLHPVRREIGMTIKPSHLLNGLFKPTWLNHSLIIH